MFWIARAEMLVLGSCTLAAAPVLVGSSPIAFDTSSGSSQVSDFASLTL